MHNCMKDINWQERLNKLTSNRIALYGAGKYGKIALKNAKKYLPHLKIVFFIDDNKTRNSNNVEGLEVYTLEEAIGQGVEFNILITNYYVPSVIKKIEKLSFDLNKVFFWGELLIEDIEYDCLVENRGSLYKVYELLEDNLSKIIFRSMIEAHFSKKFDILSFTCQNEQYFPKDIFKISEEEVFVDAGAFDGDTIRKFMQHSSQKYKHIYAFEPDKRNYAKLLSCENKSNIEIFNAGLYSKNGTIKFLANKGGSSKIDGDGTDTIRTIRFDDLKLPEKNITFVKMDIEGSELEALRGMKETIKEHKPKLAICIYHKFEDLWQLPLFIKSLVPEYRLYIRNYLGYLDEIVLYATV